MNREHPTHNLTGEANRWAVGAADLRGLTGVEDMQVNLQYIANIRVRAERMLTTVCYSKMFC